jgi:hypothetical protein
MPKMPKNEGQASKSILSGGGSGGGGNHPLVQRDGMRTRSSTHVGGDEVMSSSASIDDDNSDDDDDDGDNGIVSRNDDNSDDDDGDNGIASRTRGAISQRQKFKFFPRKGQGPRKWIPDDVMIATITMENSETGETKTFEAADVYERKKKNGDHDFCWGETRVDGEFIGYLPRDSKADAVRLAERIEEAGTGNGLVYKEGDDDDDYGWFEMANGEFLSYARQTSENTFELI